MSRKHNLRVEVTREYMVSADSDEALKQVMAQLRAGVVSVVAGSYMAVPLRRAKSMLVVKTKKAVKR